MINLNEIFNNPIHLHLAIWDRFSKDHLNVMGFVKELMEKYPDKIMPLFRPVGRGKGNATYEDYKKSRFTNCTCSTIPSLKCYSELWIHIENSINDTVLTELSNYFKNYIKSGCILIDEKTNPLWEPLGGNLQTCYLTQEINGGCKDILNFLGDKKAATLLKLLWFRSTEEIVNWLDLYGYDDFLLPPRDNQAIYNLMNNIFSDIDIRDYGLSDSIKKVNPTDFGVSHMAAFAVNTITQIKPMYLIENYFQNVGVTQPGMFRNKKEFLSQFK